MPEDRPRGRRRRGAEDRADDAPDGLGPPDPVDAGPLEATFPCEPSSLARVRTFVREACSEFGVPHGDVATLLLVANELATNCVLHGQSMVDVRLSVGRGTTRIEVGDASAVMPVLSRTSRDVAPGGRGLQIVDRLAEQWGVESVRGSGKVVWAELRHR